MNKKIYLVAVEPPVNGFSSIFSDSGWVAGLRDEVGLNRVEQAEVVELDLAQLQKILAS